MSSAEKAKQLERLFITYHPILLRIAFRYLRDMDDAEEAVQEVFVNVWSKRESLQLDESLRSYLIKSTRNRALNLIDRKKSLSPLDESPITEGIYTLQAANPEEQEKLNRIFLEIDNLPPRCREIFLLSREEGLEYSEIATFLDISVKTVETQMGIALRKLRQAVRKKY